MDQTVVQWEVVPPRSDLSPIRGDSGAGARRYARQYTGKGSIPLQHHHPASPPLSSSPPPPTTTTTSPSIGGGKSAFNALGEYLRASHASSEGHAADLTVDAVGTLPIVATPPRLLHRGVSSSSVAETELTDDLCAVQIGHPTSPSSNAHHVYNTSYDRQHLHPQQQQPHRHPPPQQHHLPPQQHHQQHHQQHQQQHHHQQ